MKEMYFPAVSTASSITLAEHYICMTENFPKCTGSSVTERMTTKAAAPVTAFQGEESAKITAAEVATDSQSATLNMAAGTTSGTEPYYISIYRNIL